LKTVMYAFLLSPVDSGDFPRGSLPAAYNSSAPSPADSSPELVQFAKDRSGQRFSMSITVAFGISTPLRQPVSIPVYSASPERKRDITSSFCFDGG
jgi:hypothetical protein